MSETSSYNSHLSSSLPKKQHTQHEPNHAADMIRKKLDAIYRTEPDAVDEAIETIGLHTNRSRHQQYMYELTTSGKPIAEVQTAWHNYYAGLNDKEKHEVWQEFYAANEQRMAEFQPSRKQQHAVAVPTENPVTPPTSLEPAPSELKINDRSVGDIKKTITSKVRVRGKLSKKQHLQSLGFGLAMGSITVFILLFGFFNERFIAPFITPSKNISSTPLIIDSATASVDESPQIIIPKINVQAPVVYDVLTIEEDDVQRGLERGIVHYVTTSNPGEQGNAVFFGHSSSNILNRGRYKYAFVLLNWLEKDDTFYIHKNGTRYVYKVFDKKIIKPTEVDVLQPIQGKTVTATLITCDPPGTNVNRLVIMGEQISPNPSTALASSAKSTEVPKILASNSESLWHRITSWLSR